MPHATTTEKLANKHYISFYFTLSLRMAGWRPQNGRVGKLGFGGLLSGPGRGEIVMPPVSVDLSYDYIHVHVYTA